MAYKISSFNYRSSGKMADEFVNMINEENFDIIALQEIKNAYAFSNIMRKLKMYSSKWEGISDNSVNDYAFIWNKKRIQLADAEEIGFSRVYEPRIYKQYKIDKNEWQKKLIRNPYYARFFPIGGAAPYIEIRIINAHIKHSKGEDNNLSTHAVRNNEFNILTKAIYAKEEDKRYGNNRPAYTILLGDYNLNHPDSICTNNLLNKNIEIMDGRNEKKIITIQTDLTTLKKHNNNESKENYFANNYDHFSYDENRFKDISVNCKSINAIKEYCDDDFEKYHIDISDHIPVVMELNIRG